jgi:hypothetical protein
MEDPQGIHEAQPLAAHAEVGDRPAFDTASPRWQEPQEPVCAVEGHRTPA